ncbi:hypothetical protein BDN70DRAFT_616949 [Pholiota conissans]|uniref:Uncharacterized protein n=1 Tax=Pholiota conissans TaxID=109636 RepID=A0A9P5Z5I9_9AGAR|nr:hypothetical protein BDN70DRAFT_616949 [Pholiota conissans]
MSSVNLTHISRTPQAPVAMIWMMKNRTGENWNERCCRRWIRSDDNTDHISTAMLNCLIAYIDVLERPSYPFKLDTLCSFAKSAPTKLSSRIRIPATSFLWLSWHTSGKYFTHVSSIAIISDICADVCQFLSKSNRVLYVTSHWPVVFAHLRIFWEMNTIIFIN